MSDNEGKGISRRRALAASLGTLGLAAAGATQAAATQRKAPKRKRVLVPLP